MPKKNSLTSKEYWEKREAYKLKKGLKDLKKIEKELVDEYKKAMNEIGKEISNLFYKYAKDNNLSYSDAKKYLNSSEFREFKRDLKSYMKLIEETGNEELLLELNTLSTKSRISRLEEMFYQCDKYINEVYEGTNKKLAEVYNGTIKDAYYQTIFDTHKAIGVATSFTYIDNDMIKEILAFPWSGRHYSERLWSNRTKLKNAMVEELTQMLIQGKGVKEVSKALSKRLDADFKNCLRLIHTEHSYFMGEATYKAYKELEVDKYQFVATLDKRTSDICQELDGKVFDMKDRVVGVNASPMHPRCRSCEIPYIQDDYSTRFARDSKGKTIEVPSNMTYKEWKEAIKENNLEEAVKAKEKTSKHDINNIPTDKKGVIKFMQDNLGVKIGNVNNINEKALKGCAEFTNDFLSKYPKLKEHPIYKNKFNITEFDGNVYADYKMSQIRLSIKSFKDYDILVNSIKRQHKTGWMITCDEGLEYKQLYAHEFGHFINDLISIDDNKFFTEEKMANEFKKQLIAEYKKTTKEKIKTSDIGRLVSDYALTNSCELFAEAFAEYYTNSNPRTFAKLFGNRLEKYLEKYK